MKTLRLAFLLSLAAVSLTPAATSAGVFVSVNIAPPPLLVYEQPVAPFPDYVWQPGYWAWDGYEYYWVPGTWVLAPEPGLYWTPGWWGWDEVGAVYIWHAGYWGPHVGFYGGINYGWGYPGYGYYGGFWEGGHFCYNTAYSHVTVVNVYKTYNQTIVNNNVVVNNNHTSFNGGHGGVHARPRPEDQRAEHEHHWQPTHEQASHERGARDNREQHWNAERQRGPAVVATESAGHFNDGGTRGPAERGSGRNRAWRDDAPSSESGAPRTERYPGSREDRPSSRSMRRPDMPEGGGDERPQRIERGDVQERPQYRERPRYHERPQTMPRGDAGPGMEGPPQYEHPQAQGGGRPEGQPRPQPQQREQRPAQGQGQEKRERKEGGGKHD
jgi:hypothetical protein